ncbi:MAG: hypothetical protein ACRDZ4_08340 [Egibacteraceae bacterium]
MLKDLTALFYWCLGAVCLGAGCGEDPNAAMIGLGAALALTGVVIFRLKVRKEAI